MDGGFGAGVLDGGLRNSFEVSILVSYILSSVATPLSAEDIQLICLEDGLANYFELSNSLRNLEELEQVQLMPGAEGLLFYALTEKGRQRAELLAGDLPRSVKDKALASAMKLLSKKKMLEENQTQILKVADGYQLCLTIPDMGTDLLSLQVFVPNLDNAQRIQSRFLHNPRFFYQGMWAVLTGDYHTAGVPNEPDDHRLD